MGVVIHDIYPSSPFLYTSSCPLIHYLPWLGGSKSLTHQSHTGIHYPSRFAQYACCHPTEPPSQSFPARDGPISQLELCLSPLQHPAGEGGLHPLNFLPPQPWGPVQVCGGRCVVTGPLRVKGGTGDGEERMESRKWGS